MDSLSLLELNSLVRRSLEQCLPDEYWIQAELSDVRSNTTGHCYLEFVQKDPRSNNLVAKARGMIWNNIYRLLKPYFEESTGQLFTSGIKVLVKVTVQFHELYGYSLTVLDIDPAYTLGDMARRRREILLQLEEEGVLTLNKELEMPVLPQRVAVISSATAAGYGDFCHQLQHNPGGFYFYTELFPALMQGNQVEESVLVALDRINARINEFDVVVIIRGGGATSDLSGFDTYLLAAACAQFPLPIITGIGHERDDTVLDSVAVSTAFSAFWKKLRSEENPYKDLYYAERKAISKYRAEALRYVIAHYKEKKQEIPTSYIKYAERSYLLQKGSALELLQKEINALESVQRELVQNITRARYGLGKTEDK